MEIQFMLNSLFIEKYYNKKLQLLNYFTLSHKISFCFYNEFKEKCKSKSPSQFQFGIKNLRYQSKNNYTSDFLLQFWSIPSFSFLSVVEKEHWNTGDKYRVILFLDEKRVSLSGTVRLVLELEIKPHRLNGSKTMIELIGE